MSAEGYLLRFFWGSREEDWSALAGRLRRFLNDLAAIDPLFRDWQAGSKTIKSIARTRPALEELIRRGLLRGNVPPYDPIPGGGYSVDLYTKAKRVLWLNMHAGAVGDDVLTNGAILHLPPAGPESRRICRAPVLEQLIRAGVAAWNPDEASVYPTSLDATLASDLDDIGVGWLTYVAHRVRRLPSFPKPIRCVPVGRAGTLVVASAQRFQASNAAHWAAVEKISAAVNPAKPAPTRAKK